MRSDFSGAAGTPKSLTRPVQNDVASILLHDMLQYLLTLRQSAIEQISLEILRHITAAFITK